MFFLRIVVVLYYRERCEFKNIVTFYEIVLNIVPKEVTLIMIIVIMGVTIMGLLWALIRITNHLEKISQRTGGINEYLFNYFLSNERQKENGRAGEGS